MILYFVSVFHLRMKTTEGLKEHLSNIRKLTYKPKACFDEYYFRAQLLCCDVLLFKEKVVPAKELIDIVLVVNKSCLQAYEYLLIYNEKDKDS